MKKTRIPLNGGGKLSANAAIAQALRERGALTQADLARLTRLGKATVSRAVAELQRAGVVIEAAGSLTPAGSVGRPAAALTLNPRSGTCLGVQLGQKSIRAVLADVSHMVLSSRVAPLDWDYSPAQALDATQRLVAEVQSLAGADPAQLIAVGMAMPSPVHPETGRIIRSSVIGGWGGLRVNEMFEERLGRPVFIENESRCAALAELMWGAGRGFSSFAYLKTEAGVSGAIIEGGRLRRGVSGGAGEFGHITYDPIGPLCRCGNRGCFEVYLSDWALLKSAQASFGEAFEMPDLIERAKGGDKGCRRILADAAEILARCVATACNVLNPQAVLLAGSLVAAGELLFNPLREHLARHVLIPVEESDMGPTTTLMKAMFGRDASALGAMGLALRQIGDAM